jgi:hypothetical protein
VRFFSRTTKTKPEGGLVIEQGRLTYVRSTGATSVIEIDSLHLAEVRVLRGEVYWYLEDESQAFVLIPESTKSIGLLRRYLSSWRGFNYDGLLSFDITAQTELRLWPLLDPLVDRAA